MLYKKNILEDEEVPWKIQKTWNNLKNEWSRKLDILTEDSSLNSSTARKEGSIIFIPDKPISSQCPISDWLKWVNPSIPAVNKKSYEPKQADFSCRFV